MCDRQWELCLLKGHHQSLGSHLLPIVMLGMLQEMPGRRLSKRRLRQREEGDNAAGNKNLCPSKDRAAQVRAPVKQVHGPRSSVAVEVLCGSPFGLHMFCVKPAALCSTKPGKLLVQQALVLLLRATAGGRSKVWLALERLRRCSA